jgi:hypothetical protein
MKDKVMDSIPAAVLSEGKAAFYKEMADDLRRLARNAGAVSVQKACDELASQYDELAAGAARVNGRPKVLPQH